MDDPLKNYKHKYKIESIIYLFYYLKKKKK